MRRSLSGNDVLTLNSRVFADVIDGDFATLTFDNEVAVVKTGKNGNAIYSQNATGRQATLVLRILRASPDDKFLNNLYNLQKAQQESFVAVTGEFIKKIGDTLGNVQSDSYLLSGGIFTKEIDAKMNVEGDTEQSVSIYTLMFSDAVRVIS